MYATSRKVQKEGSSQGDMGSKAGYTYLRRGVQFGDGHASQERGLL